MNIPTNLLYVESHEWVLRTGNIATLGITEHAVEALGDIIYVQLPSPGDHIGRGGAVCEIESTKSVSDVYAPFDGEVIEVNERLVDDPGLLNREPYAAGWLVRFRFSVWPELLTADEYARAVADA